MMHGRLPAQHPYEWLGQKLLPMPSPEREQVPERKLDPERELVLKNLGYAVAHLKERMNIRLIPEVGMNIAYALRGARIPEDVAAVSGRIVRMDNRVHPVGRIAFGASDHVARIVLTVMKFDPMIRCAANIRFSEEILDVLDEQMLEIHSFDRTKEPPGLKTMDWGVAFCCRESVPDVIYDHGAVGKEAMIRMLGEDPQMVTQNILKLSARINDAEQ